METQNKNKSVDDLFRQIALDVVFNKAPLPLDFVFPGLLAGTIGALVSAGGTGKSLFAIQLATAIAGGGDTTGLGWVPVGAAARKVVYMPAEDPVVALEHRFHCLGGLLTCSARAMVAENLSVYSVSGGPNVLNEKWFEGLRRRAVGARLLILDTLRRFHSADENSSGDMTRVVSALEALAKDTGAAIIFLHHIAKGAALNGGGGEQQASRGSSVLVDNVRWQINITGMTDKEATPGKIDQCNRRRFVKLSMSKSNYAAAVEDKWLLRGPNGFLMHCPHPSKVDPLATAVGDFDRGQARDAPVSRHICA